MMAPRQQQQSGRRNVATPSITTTASRLGAPGAGGTGAGGAMGGGEGPGRGGRRAGDTAATGRATGASEARETDAQKRLITAMFERAVDIIQHLPKTGPIQTSYEDKLLLYSLFKQATEGSVKTSRPGMLDILGRAKWDAWNKRRDLSEEDAKRLYVDSLIKILRNYRDDAQAVSLIRELENFTADPRDLVRSGHSLTEGTRATAGRQRSSTSRGSSEDESDASSSVPPASLGPYVSKSQLPAPVEAQEPPSDRKSIPDSAKAGPSRGRGRTPRRGEQQYDEDEDDSDQSSTESIDRSGVPPSRSAPSRAFSHRGGHLPPPPPLPLPPHPGQLRHHTLTGPGSSIYGPARSFGAATPAGMISGISTPAGAGTPFPPGVGRYPGHHAPPSLGGGPAPWAQGSQPVANLPPIPPSQYRSSGYPHSLQVVGASPQAVGAVGPSPTAAQPVTGTGSVRSGDPATRSMEQALDSMQTSLVALQEQMAAMERARASERHSGVISTALRRTMRKILYLMGLQRTSASTAREPEFPLTTGRFIYAVVAGFFGAARQVTVDAVLIFAMVGMFLRWRRGQTLVGWRDLWRWMVGDGGANGQQRRLEG